MEQTQLSKRVQTNKTFKLKTKIEFVTSSSRPFGIFMNIRLPKLLLQFVFILCAFSTAFSAKPNVILIMADDLATRIYPVTEVHALRRRASINSQRKELSLQITMRAILSAHHLEWHYFQGPTLHASGGVGECWVMVSQANQECRPVCTPLQKPFAMQGTALQ